MFTLLSLPREVQLNVFEHCEWDTLAQTCRASKDVCAKAQPILWRYLDFKSDDVDDPLVTMGMFMITCDQLSRENPERWNTLKTYPRSLRMRRIEGTRVPHGDQGPGDEMLWCGGFGGSESHSILNIIASLVNLQELSLWVKHSLDQDDQTEEIAANLAEGLPNLEVAEIGGNLSEGVVLGILSRPEKLRSLSCIAPLDGQGGQESHDGGQIFLESITGSFQCLTSLHLCKLGELTTDRDVTGLRWDFDHDGDRMVLEDWGHLLPRVSGTLVELTLEDRYLTRSYSDDERDPTWGEESSQRFREVLVPILAKQNWPKLEQLTLIGLTAGGTLLLPERIDFNEEEGTMAGFNDDVTPLVVSPGGSFSL